MSAPFCNVALPVPLRTTFTYTIPESLRATLQPGTRVLVPFRKKSLVGVVVELSSEPPANTRLREITKVMELSPAITPKLIELAQWIANYYLAPIGEVLRAMLPPLTELNVRREIILTSNGRAAAESLGGGELSHGLAAAEAAFLEKANAKKAPVPFGMAAKMGISSAALQRLQQRGLIEIRESLRDTKRKSQIIVAWKGFQGGAEKSLKEKEERVRALLETERGPLP
ncbi:MAG: hypothetical protein WBD19_13670, partial [Candidatus Acidiferrum sp.]